MIQSSFISQRTSNGLIITLLALGGGLVLARLGLEIKLPILLAVLVFFMAMSASFVRGTEGLYLIIFGMLFSPEVGGSMGTGRATGEGSNMVVRLEDIIMLAVVAGWILRSAYSHRRHGIINTKVNAAIWIYMGASIIATLLGTIQGSVRSFVSGLFNNLKYFEYFLLFFMILAHVRAEKVIKNMLRALFIVFFLAMIYGYTQIAPHKRVCAPFDTEPNTFGGYIVLIMSLAGGIALQCKSIKTRFIMIFLILFGLTPLMFTLSRASYMGFIFSGAAFIAISSKRLIIFAVAMIFVAIMAFGMNILPDRVQERISGTFERENQYHVAIGTVDLDASASARIISYQIALKRWVKSPIFGYGVTGTHFIDGQYPRLLAETGIVGLSAFLYMLWRLIMAIKKVYNDARDPMLKGAALGFLCGIIGMIGHGFSANTFIIVRIAEPFWLIAALVLLIPVVEENQRAETAPAI